MSRNGQHALPALCMMAFEAPSWMQESMPKLFHHSYDKIKLLGEGAFGSAYLVRPKELRNVFQVAKEIRISHLTDKQREGAVAESEVLRMLKHPNIIAYIDSFSEGNRMYIVMEYADGGDLAAQIKEQKDNHSRFEEREIMRIFVQLVLALIYIHSRKVLHRDLKPLNIFLTMQGIVKLGDFGIARVLDSSTAGAQTTIGTPHYLSPEMVNNEAYGTRSDLWSLGVVTYELAALRVPFGGNSLPAVAMKIMGADPDPLLDRSSDLSWIVFGLLAKDPNDRPRLEAVQRMPFVQKYIQELLCYSKETGNGGCEAMTASLERERRDRSQPSREREAESASEPGERSPARERSVRSEQSERRAEFRDARSKKTHGSFRDVQQEAAHAEFLRTRKAALDAKRRAEAENAEALQVNSRERPRWGMDEDCGAAEVEVRREKPFRERKAEEDRLSGKEREAAVKRQAQAARDELESAHLNALGKAMREHQEEKKRLALRFKRTEEVLPPPEDFEDDSPSGKEPCKDKRAEEAEYLRKLEQAREEAAEERRRLAEKVAARAADDEVSAGSGEEAMPKSQLDIA
ncbi:unnamed protein product [Effrenium voratum]|nr:unnamed protein product [Effrenium voratum]